MSNIYKSTAILLLALPIVLIPQVPPIEYHPASVNQLVPIEKHVERISEFKEQPKALLATKPPETSKTASPQATSDCLTEIQKYDWDKNTAKAIGLAESGLNPNSRGDISLTYVQNGITYGDSWGCFQIRYLPGRPNPDWLKVPANNVEMAYKLYKANGWQPWSVWLNGNYRKFL